jgi:hypothetical protein
LSASDEIFLGDLLAAVRRLEATDPADRKAIAELLGFELATTATRGTPTARSRTTPTESREPSTEPAARRAPEGAGRRAPPVRPAPAPQSLRGLAPRRIPQPRPSQLTTLSASAAAPPPHWVVNATALPAPDRAGAPPPDRPQPLLLPRWTAGVLQVMLATEAESTAVDIERTIDALARQRVLRDLPRRREPTLRRGVQLLVEAGTAMAPFRGDLDDATRAVRRVVGDEAVETLYFAGSPLRGAGPGPRVDWKPYEPPRRPRPILVLGDLGVHRPRLGDESATPSEWLAFIETAAAAQCRVVVLTPYPVSRLAPPLRRAVDVVTWDRTTTASNVRQVLGGVLGRA